MLTPLTSDSTSFSAFSMSDDRSKQVYIGYLPNDARMEDVEDFFKGFFSTEQ